MSTQICLDVEEEFQFAQRLMVALNANTRTQSVDIAKSFLNASVFKEYDFEFIDTKLRNSAESVWIGVPLSVTIMYTLY